MSIWMIALGVLALGGLALALLPLFGPRPVWGEAETTELDELLAKKARLLRSIKDVDHEREAGMLSEADWRETRDEFLADAVRLNRRIGELTGIDPTAAEATPSPRQA